MPGDVFTKKMSWGDRLWKVVSDSNMKAYSSLQKMVILLIIIIFISWLISLWILPIFFIAGVIAGVKVSDQILHREKSSALAEQLFFKLESAYIELCTISQIIKTHIFDVQEVDTVSTSSLQVIDDLSAIYDNEGDKTINSAVKIPNAVWSEMNSIQLLIIRDFIGSWYGDFSYDTQFLKDIKHLLQHAFNNLALHISQQDSKLIICKIVHLYQQHFTLYTSAMNSFKSHQLPSQIKVPSNDNFKRHLSVNDAFGSLTHFHCALGSDVNELNYLRGIVSILVLSVVSAHVVETQCTRTLLVEILSTNVLLPIMQRIANPDWIMEVIIQLTSDENIVSDSFDCDENSKRTDTSVGAESECSSEGLNFSIPVSKEELSSKLNENVINTIIDCLKADKPNSPMVTDRNISEMLQTEKEMHHHTLCSTDHQMVTFHEDVEFTHHILKPDSHLMSADANKVNEELLSDITWEEALMDSEATVSEETREKVVFDLPLFTSGDNVESIIKSQTNESCFDNDPQGIISFNNRSSSDSFISTHSVMADSSEQSRLSFSSDSSSSSDIMSSSITKFASFKNFFMDSLSGKQNIKKPKTLDLFPEKKTSNFNPFNFKSKHDAYCSNDNTQKPPQLMIDGVPIESSDSAFKRKDSCSPTYSDSELTPSPSFLSSMNNFLHFSSSHPDLISPQGSLENVGNSPEPTPSPTTFNEFNGGDIATAKEQDLQRPHLSDDMRIFQDVSIPSTRINTEFRSSSQYSLYIIEYEALYFTDEGKSVIRSGEVMRRYREFTNLHSRLERHQAYKKYLKNIKGPKGWLTLPFKSMDKDTVEGRRLFLEKYLKDLIEIEAICNGPDLREFLAYEGDSHIAFVKKSPDITVPRIDKMFLRGVSGVVDRIKALPNIPQEVMSGFRGRDTPDDKLSRSKIQWDMDTIDFVSDFISEEEMNDSGNILDTTCAQLLDDLITDEDKELFLVSDVISDVKASEQAKEVYRQEIEKLLADIHTAQGSQTTDEASDLGFAVLELLVCGLEKKDHWICRDRVVKSIQAVLGKALNRYLDSAISNLTSEPKVTLYLRLLRETVWPQGQLRSSSYPNKSKELRALTRSQAKRCLINFFPESIRLVIGRNDFEDMIDTFLSSIESEQLNRHLLYQILDYLMEQLFPEMVSQEFLHNLCFKFRTDQPL